MQIHQVPGEGYFADAIRTFKRRSLAEEFSLASVLMEWYEPLSVAQYFLARTDDGTRAIGLAEGYFFDQVCDGYEFLRPQLASSVEPLCPFEHLAYAGAFYVEPKFRSRSAYLYLHLVLIYLAVQLGAQGALCLTNAQSHAHRRLYEKTGGLFVAEFEVTYSSEVRLAHAAYYFDLPVVLRHPRLQRALEICRFDSELAEATYNWRYDSSAPALPMPALFADD